jgi:hypothetical protein
MIQAMSQHQQAVPVQAQYAANGGHLFGDGDDIEFQTTPYAEVPEGKIQV